jgi:hypothetical protein
MGEKLIIGPFKSGLRTNVTAFNIDNDSFPTLVNAYQWRDRIKRKRGTSLLVRLSRFFNSNSVSYNPGTATLTFDGSGKANLFTGFAGFNFEVNASIVPGSVTITVGANIYTDPTKDGFLTPTGTSGPNTINYITGEILIPVEAGKTAIATFNYYPSLPVMGLRDLILDGTQFPGTIAFDTTYSYNITTGIPYTVYDVSFYKNPTTPNTAKSNPTPTWWNGQDYQQFWTVNYQGALWATNGIDIGPTTLGSIGMQFAPASTITYVSNTATTLVITITNCPLIVGDYVFVNEWGASTPAIASTLNFQTGYITASAPNTAALATKTVTITFTNGTAASTIGTGPFTPGIVQYLTTRVNTAIDCIRFYDGDPTNGNATTPILNGRLGWVNFCPPLNQIVAFPNFSIADLPPAEYYLVGAKLIWTYKDRLLFLGPVVQTSGLNAKPIYLQDTVIYSQNGTPYYTSIFAGNAPTAATTVFTPMLVPANQTATASAWFEDSTGFGGFITAGIDQAINTVANNEDVLIIGFQNRQTRFVYTGNDILPFNFFSINSEMGSASTFSVITLDKGVLTSGSRGLIITSQTDCSRYDLEILDQVFQFNLLNNGTERVTAQRDFINEWCYLTYNSDQEKESIFRFPNQTLQYNYRDNSWAIFNETYTTYGQFRTTSGLTWSTVGTIFPTWGVWNSPWNSGSSNIKQPKVIAGNQQGFVLVRENGTGESNSLYIQSISVTTITSPDHGLNNGDYIVISGAIGAISSQINGNIFSVANATENTFDLVNPITSTGTDYSGGGLIQRMYIPFIQTKQFNPGWGMTRKTRIGAQQYLLTSTNNGQVQLLIFLSENPLNDPTAAYNIGGIVPQVALNNTLLYSTIIYTCPEGINLGLTPANINLQTPTTNKQNQIWHRMNTSLIGDTVQLAITLSDDQMRDPTFSNQFAEIELHGIIMDLSSSQLLV